MSLKYKILLIIFSVALIPIFIMSITTARISTDLLVEQEVGSKINILRDISGKVYQATQERQLVGINFLLDQNVQKLLSPESNQSLTLSQREKLIFEIDKLLQNYKYLAGTEALFLFSTGGTRYTNSPSSVWNLADFTENAWFDFAVGQQKSYFWGNPMIRDGATVIPLVRVIRKIAYPETIGYLISNIKESYLYNLYSNFVNKGTSDFFIVNQMNYIISHSDKTKIGYELSAVMPDLQWPMENEGDSTVDMAGQQFLLTHYTDPRNNWTYFNIVPGREIRKGARYILIFTYVLSGVLIIVCFLLAFLFTRSVVNPIKSLVTRMEKAQSGDWDVRAETNKRGEIGKLEHSFDIMIKELKMAFDDMVAVQEQKRKAELKVLEFQINPHFLYNTMSTIIWLSDMHDNESVVKVAASLSELFRISISKGRETISIDDELNHVKHYIAIQRVRYADEFSVIYDVDDAIRNYFTIKLILQPIVENAIYHGIKPSESGDSSGEIRIAGSFIAGDSIQFLVMNNGNILQRDEVRDLNAFLEQKERTNSDFGVGIKNVHERLQLAYGLKYGLGFVYDEFWTIVTIQIPRVAAKPLSGYDQLIEYKE